ncbi:NADPH-dependent FMN reductase [Rubritalea sp.]|uniref:NADPH-dependent FMN reductase n=1 Tax=Rubritalea sp. TaxID=2109375 RepID=UPI003EF7DDA7
MEHVTIIATSLNPESKSQDLARIFQSKLEGVSSELIDLRELPLPMAGSAEGWSSENAAQLKAAVERASHVVFAVPIYCYDVNAAAKNVIELVGRSFTKKVVGFICSAGGDNSYMSVMGFANHLMLDFRSVICPRFVYVSPSSWQENGELDTKLIERIQILVGDLSERHSSPTTDKRTDFDFYLMVIVG